jgi:hypothetical protein
MFRREGANTSLEGWGKLDGMGMEAQFKIDLRVITV